MFDGRFRTGVDRVVRPVGRMLRRTRLSPDHLTAFGLALAVPTAVVIGAGHLHLGLALLVFSAVPDLLDGALAKEAGRATVRGAFFDSVADRVTDTLVLGGVGWYLASSRGGHAAMLAFAVLGTSLLISYLRAKAESLGFDAKGGLMERAERIVVLCVGLLFSFLLIPVLWLMLALTLFTAGQRFFKVWRQATAAEDLRTAARLRRQEAAEAQAARRAARARRVEDPWPPMSARWKAWWEANGRAVRGERYAQGSRRSGAAERWRERRQERWRAGGDHGAANRKGSRRP